MKQLSATELLPIGLGDDQGAYGFLTALDPWMEQLFAKLVTVLPPPPPSASTSASAAVGARSTPLASPQYTITTQAASSGHASGGEQGQTKTPEHGGEGGDERLLLALEQHPPVGYQTSTASPLRATVTSNTRLTAPSWQQNVFHVAMTLPPPTPLSSASASATASPSHVAGDVLIVYPSNSPDLVTLAENYFSTEFPDPANTVINIQYTQRKNSRKNRLLAGQCSPSRPSSSLRCTVRELFTHFLGLSNVPQRSFFEALSRFVPTLTLGDNTNTPYSAADQALYDENEEEREKLVELASAEGADLYDSYCFQEQRGCLEILTEFRTLRNGQVPLHRFLELVPPLLSRHYSIASSGHKTPNEVG